MTKDSLREQASIFQRFFEEATLLEGISINDSHLKISNTIKFIQKVIEPFTIDPASYDKTVFIMGPSGVGKSTLMNYIAGNQLYFQTHNDRPGIFPQSDTAIAYVGQGEGSTTLAPNIWQPGAGHFQGITFIDCAGDFDSAGTIVEVINSKIKATVAKNVQNAKILIVTSQSSISPEGSYGLIFKAGLEKSAQFLNDIDYFQDSMGLVVSHAGRINGTQRTVESFLGDVIRNPQVEKYKIALEKLVSSKYIEIFSKYSDEINEMDIYAPPAWNANQRDKIIQLIDKIEFKSIPRGLFNDTSSTDVREQMTNAFNILKTKAVDLLQNSMHNTMQNKISIRSTELKKFAHFVEDEIICNKVHTGFEQYIKHLNNYNYFKVSLSEEMIKLNGELEFIAPFTKNHQQSRCVQEDWGNLIDSNLLLKDVLHEAKMIIHEANGLFSSFIEKEKIITVGCFDEYSSQIKMSFNDLYTAYKNKASIENDKNSDKYHFYRTEKQFKCMNKIPYSEQQAYTASEAYTVSVPYEAEESYTDYKFERYIKRGHPSEHHCRHHYLPEPESWTLRHLGRGDYECTRNVPVQKKRSVVKYKDETKYKDVIKYQTVTKFQDVPEYQDVQVKKFDSNKYNTAITDIDNIIKGLRTNAQDTLNHMKATNTKVKQVLPLQMTDLAANVARTNCLTDVVRNDEIKELFDQLNQEWKYAEYEAQALLDCQIQVTGSIIS